MKYLFLIVFATVLTTFQLSAQKYTEMQLRTVLDSAALRQKGLNNELQLNVTNLQLAELVSSVALENNLNLSIDPGLNQVISYNFFNAQVKDMLVFLYLNFDIEIDFIGSIISVRKREKVITPTVVPKKEPEISYNNANTFLSMDLKGDTLWKVAEKVTRLTGKNFVIDPQIRNKPVSAFLQNRPSDEVLQMFARSNGLEIVKDETGYYYIDPETVVQQKEAGTTGQKGGNNRTLGATTTPEGFFLEKNADGTLNVKARNVPIYDIVQIASQEAGVHYVQYSKLDGVATLELNNVSYEQLLNRLFNSTNYSARKDDGIYIIGESKQEGIRRSELVRLENRTIESVKSVLPKDLTAGLEITEFVELNGLIISGNDRQIEELKSFVSSIDVVVPMVQIDVMLLYSGKRNNISSGINAGLGQKETAGTVFPGLDMTLGFNTINDILNAINGFGVVNLGQVTENFYVTLQLLEENSIIDIESTPKISTLNGHQANISIGETTYYQEQQVSFQPVGAGTGFSQNSQVWKDLSANLSVDIKPFVSADEYVTLTITVKQEDFGARSAENAPPDRTNQTFESVIRVKNGEVILLGGLEKKEVSNSGSGTPFLSRIPVIKWFFSSRQRTKEKSKLHILIRPTVTY